MGKANGQLKEVVKSKDAKIAAMFYDFKNARSGNAMEHCTKTGASSHESNEAAILRHKNRKLQKTLRAKQQTITELLQLVGKVTQQQGAESSAVEELHDDDDDADDSEPTIQKEKEEKKTREEDNSAQERLATVGKATRFQVHGSIGRAIRGRGGGR